MRHDDAPGAPPQPPQEEEGEARRPSAGDASQAAPQVAATINIWHLLARAYAMCLNHFAFSCGCLLLIQALQAGREWATPDAAGLAGFLEALRLMVGNFVAPFSKTVAIAIFPSEVLDVKVLAFWVPTMLGSFVCSIGVLGHLSMKFRRPLVVLPYVILSAAHLVWQSELGKILRQVAQAEDLSELKALSERSRVSDMQVALFEAPYEHFTSMYTQLRCTATASDQASQPVSLQCATGSFEGKMFQFAVQEFCRARPTDRPEAIKAFGRRVEACMTQGREAKVMAQTPPALATVFCRCRAAAYDCIRSICPWISAIWCLQLLGVCIAMYFAVERNLSAMDPEQQHQVLWFGVVGMLALIGRAVVFADFFDDEVLDADMGR